MAGTRETKLAALARLLRRLRRRGEPAIVFTEYRDTLVHIQQTLALDGVLLHGGLSRSERRRAVETFVSGRAWTLLATDAGAEGLNLHHSCRVVIHVELPWNPVRLEQRTGRVDRIGQARTVHAVHLIARGTGEMRILARLQSRIRAARRDIPVADPLRSPGGPDAGERRRAGELSTPRSARPSATTGVPAEEIGAPAEVPPADRQIVRLADEAAAETSRIHRSRAQAADEIDLTTRDVAHARGATRAVLRGRALVLVGTRHSKIRAAAASVRTCRRCSSSRQPGPRAARPRRWCRHGSNQQRSPAPSPATAERAAWQTESARTHRLFWQAALTRGRAIEQAIRTAAAAPFQPGLFDDRREHGRPASSDEHARPCRRSRATLRRLLRAR